VLPGMQQDAARRLNHWVPPVARSVTATGPPSRHGSVRRPRFSEAASDTRTYRPSLQPAMPRARPWGVHPRSGLSELSSGVARFALRSPPWYESSAHLYFCE
jgi:hypothetical protein